MVQIIDEEENKRQQELINASTTTYTNGDPIVITVKKGF